MRIVTAAASAVLVVAVAACGSSKPAPPAHSAAAACRDFQNWYLAQPSGNLASGKDAGTLTNAVHEAPSGGLYSDMNTLQSDVDSTETAGSSLAQPEEDMTVSAAYQVEQDCQSVNPSS
jgi:hypothetical protein